MMPAFQVGEGGGTIVFSHLYHLYPLTMLWLMTVTFVYLRWR